MKSYLNEFGDIVTNQSEWTVIIDKLLNEEKYKSISKIIASDNAWVRLNYKQKEHKITSDDNWESIITICEKMLQ